MCSVCMKKVNHEVEGRGLGLLKTQTKVNKK